MAESRHNLQPLITTNVTALRSFYRTAHRTGDLRSWQCQTLRGLYSPCVQWDAPCQLFQVVRPLQYAACLVKGVSVHYLVTNPSVLLEDSVLRLPSYLAVQCGNEIWPLEGLVLSNLDSLYFGQKQMVVFLYVEKLFYMNEKTHYSFWRVPFSFFHTRTTVAQVRIT